MFNADEIIAFNANDPEIKEIMEITARNLAIKSYNSEAVTPNVYSFRAECPYDVGLVAKVLFDQKINFKMEHRPHVNGEMLAELHTDIDLESLRKVIGSQIDMHVVIQTLRPIPLKDNMMNRDHSIDWTIY